MYALFTEVNADESLIEVARPYLQQTAAPGARELGALAGYWLAPQGGRGISVVIFDNEGDAQKAAAFLRVGDPPRPDAPPGVTVKTVEVREVLAAVDRD
jgi:hypothetical protein